jgi:hypothetical protein
MRIKFGRDHIRSLDSKAYWSMQRRHRGPWSDRTPPSGGRGPTVRFTHGGTSRRPRPRRPPGPVAGGRDVTPTPTRCAVGRPRRGARGAAGSQPTDGPGDGRGARALRLREKAASVRRATKQQWEWGPTESECPCPLIWCAASVGPGRDACTYVRTYYASRSTTRSLLTSVSHAQPKTDGVDRCDMCSLARL